MPDQPDDPIHYDMKIPPEPKDATLHKDDSEHRGSDDVTRESDEERNDSDRAGNPSQK